DLVRDVVHGTPVHVDLDGADSGEVGRSGPYLRDEHGGEVGIVTRSVAAAGEAGDERGDAGTEPHAAHGRRCQRVSTGGLVYDARGRAHHDWLNAGEGREQVLSFQGVEVVLPQFGDVLGRRESGRRQHLGVAVADVPAETGAQCPAD